MVGMQDLAEKIEKIKSSVEGVVYEFERPVDIMNELSSDKKKVEETGEKN
jgi:hypothetical protein